MNYYILDNGIYGDPLIFTILLSFTLAFSSNEKSDILILFFMLFWGRSLLIVFKKYNNLEDKWNILESGDVICLKYIKEKLKKSY